MFPGWLGCLAGGNFLAWDVIEFLFVTGGVLLLVAFASGLFIFLAWVLMEYFL